MVEGRKGHAEDMPHADRRLIKRESVDYSSVLDRVTGASNPPFRHASHAEAFEIRSW